MKIYISSDHGGFELKNFLKENLPELNLIDLGPHEIDSSDDYSDFGAILSQTIQGEEDSFGILICRTGIGMSIVANKFKSINAALCFTKEHAKKAREHNNANVLCLDSDFGDFETHKEIVFEFMNTSFSSEERHQRRVTKIKEIENENFK